MDRGPHSATAARRAWRERLAGAPISWGACEIPGWGVMPAAERVLGEMARLGLRGTELGAPGFLPREPAALKGMLARHGLGLVGGFVPLVLHERRFDAPAARDAVALIARSGGRVLVLGAVQDLRWSPAQPLDQAGWRRFAQHVRQLVALAGEEGVTVALHPHVGTLVESAEQVGRALELLDVGWCLDTGHLLIGGTDPSAFARDHGDRVVHVHLKDVDAGLAAQLRARRRTLLSATQAGLFLPLGRGEARIESVLAELDRHAYDGWLVLEQDTAVSADEPAQLGGPMRDAEQSIAFLSARVTARA